MDFTVKMKSCKMFQDISKNYVNRLLLISFGLVILFSVSPAFAIAPVWDFFPLHHNHGGVGFPPPVGIQVTDAAANLDPVAIDTVTISITSTVDPTGISLTLVETGVNTGIFRNSNLIFMHGPYLFPTSSSVTISIPDSSSNTNSMIKETINDVRVKSSSDTIGFDPILTETGPDSGIFETSIKFGGTTNPATNTIEAVGGDILSIIDLATGELTNGLLIPNPDPSVGAIEAEVAVNSVTASYQGDSSSIDIGNSGNPGRGGGGLIAPSLVIDSPATGGGSNISEPPTIGKSLDQTRQLVEKGFCIDSDCFTVTKLFHEEFKLYEMMTGTHTITTTIYCAHGVDKCRYAAIGIMPYDKDMNDAVWKIEFIRDHFDNWKTIIEDPEGFLGDVIVNAEIVDKKFLLVDYTIEFKNKETPPMKVGVQLRDNQEGVRNFYFNDGIKFNDSDAYPYVQTFYEKPLEVEPLCLNEDSSHRHSCAFDKVREWAIEKAEQVLRQMMNNQYVYDK